MAAHNETDELSPRVTPAAKASIKLDLADAPDEVVGQTLGRYKLLERVGEGGCGVVCMAEQTGLVRRRVALKVIKRVMRGPRSGETPGTWKTPGREQGALDRADLISGVRWMARVYSLGFGRLELDYALRTKPEL